MLISNIDVRWNMYVHRDDVKHAEETEIAKSE